MSALIKDTAFSFIPGTPGTPGDPGTPSTPAYCTTVTATEGGGAGYYVLEAIEATPTSSATTRWVWISTGPATSSTSTVCYPATAGTPPTPGTPGTASQLIADYKLGWNAGAVGVAVQGGNCILSLQVSPTSIGVVAGLNNGNEGAGYTEIDYGIYFTHGRAVVYELGVPKSSPVTFVTGDVFRVQRLGVLVRYLKNDMVLYTSDVTSYGLLFADASLYSGGDKIVAAWEVIGSASGSMLPLGGLGANKRYAESRGSLMAVTGSATATGMNESFGVMSPLAGGGSNKPYASAQGEMLPMRGEATAGLSGSLGVLLPLAGTAANKPYASAQGVLSPLSGEASTGLLQPSYTLASGSLAVLLGSSRVLTGEVSSVSAGLLPLAGLSANHAYTESRGTLIPLQGFSAQAVVVDGHAFLAAPAGTLYAAGHDSTGENAANITAPMADLSAFMGMAANVRAPRATLSASATGTNWLTAEVTAPAGTLAASGTVSGISRADLHAPMATLIGYGGTVASITLTGHPTLQASMTSGSVSQAGITAPMAELTLFELTTEAYCSADLIAPMGQMGSTLQAWIMAPMATLTAIGTAVVTASYEAYAVNLNHNDPAVHDELTRYTNFPFNRVVRYQGSYYGANATGLYLLEGTTDDGVAIQWNFKTAMTDFKSPFLKTVVSAYFGGRLGSAATIDLHVGEDGAQSYSYATVRSDHAQNYRQTFGRGLKSRYYALGASGADTLELDNIEFNTLNSTRRI